MHTLTHIVAEAGFVSAGVFAVAVMVRTIRDNAAAIARALGA